MGASVPEHRYQVTIRWTGNLGAGTAAYNPEELLVASLSACHMLWALHLAADAGIAAPA